VIGTFQLDSLDPFLLLDEFKSDRADDYIAGFPDHPHRGFETVTYMLAGSMLHKDHKGNTGHLDPGSVQWMTAGRGIVHSEMPQQENGLMWGFQLWVNLPAKDKMCEPRYQDIPGAAVPEWTGDGIKLRVIAGEAQGVTGAIQGIATRPLYLDVHLEKGASLKQPVPLGHSAMVYVYQGAARVGTESIAAGHLAVLGDGDEVQVAAPEEPGRLLIIAAQPLNEPVARYGPFVMNTRAELNQAFEDFSAGRF
jgi:redox-sensitive bicupin YhaK (pirin superfamily)